MKHTFPDTLIINMTKDEDLRYGENPHQKSALYSIEGVESKFKKISGLKELSYNNIIDVESAWDCVDEFIEPTVVIIKHTNPCGAATGEDLIEAYRKALICDPQSAFGSIIACNKKVTSYFVEELKDLFVEAIVAPSFTPESLAILTRKKKNCRIVQVNPELKNNLKIISTSSGLLLQTIDKLVPTEEWTTVTKKELDKDLTKDLNFAWKIAKHCKSNAIVLAQNQATIGVGCGQMSRIDALNLAITKSSLGHGTRLGSFKASGAVMASDAFFPFADCIEQAAGYDIAACIQPGGSIRDKDSIDAANKHGISMVFTGRRHFRH